MNILRKVKLSVALVSSLGLCHCKLGLKIEENDGDAGSSARVTYSSHIGKILSENCVSCHSSGEIAPFTLESYDDAASKAAWILDAVQSRTMPPSNMDNSGSCNKFTNSRWLSDTQIGWIREWVTSGAQQGSESYQEPPPASLAQLDRTDLLLEMSQAYTPSPDVKDEYRCFILEQTIPTGMASSMVGYEVVPGDRQQDHHLVLMSFTSDAAVTAARAIDDASTEPGFPCYGGVLDTDNVAIWSAGGAAFEFPRNAGYLLPTSRPFVVQMHYNSDNGVRPDITRVKLKLEATATPIWPILMGSFYLSLTKGNPAIEVTSNSSFGLPTDGDSNIYIPAGFNVNIIAVFPHMHKLGKTMKLELTKLADATNPEKGVCLANVHKWNFNWQDTSTYETPVVLTPGTYRVKTTCVYDTTKNWPAGVPENATITFGEGNGDEMCLGFLYGTVDSF